ncbi:MAG: ECF transporter S component [Lachnospiraceae bacterium]|nr:ECF transporter S component [Lachnospiraceae bacterium]MBQ7776971.1 ECF transporter S component [Lachnospiraceae bacterium]
MKTEKTFNMVLTGLFMAIIIIMATVPNIGYINLILIKVTMVHVPVIIGSIVLGPKLGAVLGATFGITSLINNTFNPSLLSFAFSPFYQVGNIGGNGWSVVIALLPRILVGVVPYFVYRLLMKVLPQIKVRGAVSLAVAGISGALTNTLLVMNLIYFCFREEFAAAKEIAVEAVYDVILGIIAANGIPEAVVGAVLTMLVGGALLKVKRK